MLRITFCDPVTPSMQGAFFFNLNVSFLIFLIITMVAWIMYVLLNNFIELNNTQTLKFYHSNVIEIIWTSIPALMLLALASPSFSLLYSMEDCCSCPTINIKVLGYQWYWCYEMTEIDFCSKQSGGFRFSSYMLIHETLKEKSLLGLFRNLETNKRLWLPTKTNIQLLVSAIDVLHSWAVPSFGIKLDACPGRLFSTIIWLKQVGVFFGQCSEICGVNHGFMPISIVAVSQEKYFMNSVMPQIYSENTKNNTFWVYYRAMHGV